MKNKTNKIVPRGMSQPCVDECAAPGEARVAVNVRECDDALRVVGPPAAVVNIPAGHRLLLVDDNRFLTLHDRQVWHDGTIVTTLDDDMVGAHRVGGLVVLVTSAGMTWLRHMAQGYSVVRLADACPDITLSALEGSTLSAGMDAVTFAAPYAQWPATLSTSDVSALGTQLRRAWSELQADIDAAGAYGGMMQVRVGVRLMDDTYLWLGEPVELGHDTQSDAQPVEAECVLDGTQVTGIPVTTLRRHRYRVGITVQDGIAADWLPLVKAVDVLATTCASVVAPNGTAQYRCIAIGGSVLRPRLQFGLPPVSNGAIRDSLALSGWHVIASTTDIAALAQHRWVSDAVATTSEVVTSGITSYVVTRALEAANRLSAEQAQAIGASRAPISPVSSMTCNGRLYCISADGVLTVSAVGNPLVAPRQQAITGTTVRAIMPLSRPVYSNGFGRYPVVLFTDEGIYALPQTTAGVSFGEARLLDRAVIAPGCRPVEGNRDIYFTSRRGHLCRLQGGVVASVWRDVGTCPMAWDDAHHELWLRTSGDAMLAVMPASRASRRTTASAQLYGDALHALVVTSAGQVLDLTQETASTSVAVEWQSHPVIMRTPHQVVWQVMGQGVLSLRVSGERGISCHGFVVGRLDVRGTVNAPLRQHLLSPPLRSARLQVSGTAASGTLLLPTTLS